MIEISKKRHLIEEACKKFPGQAPINTYQHVTHAKILKPKKIIPQNMLQSSLDYPRYLGVPDFGA